jgi:carboxylate-amine ligase
VLTIGVEEEFLLLAEDGSVNPVAARVVRLAGQPEQIKPEYMAYQLETATSVCTRLDQLRRDLVRLRLIAADAAERAGARLAAVGAAPVAAGPLGALSDDHRFHAMANHFPATATAGATCACHVHVGMPDRNLAVAVLARLRPWLPVLLALTVNSPFADARDTGWASYRYHTQLQWPTFRPPGAWADAERYDRVVQSLVVSGAAMDLAGVYFLARLSARYPTIEVRVADTCLDVEDTVLYAGVVRALIASLVDDVRRRVKVVPVPGPLVDAQLLTAAHGQVRLRHGVPGDPDQSAASGAAARLLAKIEPYLAATDAADEVYAGIDRVRRNGTGADRQRRMWTWSDQPRGFVRSLAEATVPVAMAR